jgi:hypothetical protein
VRWWNRSDGASIVINGNAHIRCANGTPANTIIVTHRNPLAFTKWLLLDRTGSR